MANKKRKPVLATLGYYLTFIHYFGFSINPNDDVNSRYLSVRVKRATAPSKSASASVSAVAAAVAGSANNNDNNSNNDLWWASYNVRAQRKFGSITMLLISVLKRTIKFTAISFTTFIALNHFIVLADYVYQGSKQFVELMLEVRLVISKLSALIFVLTWHWKQSEVRQLIKLVKSTSIYILGTNASGQISPELHLESPILAFKGVAQAEQLTSHYEGETTAGKTRKKHSKQHRYNDNIHSKRGVVDSEGEIEEIGENIHLDTKHIDRRILKWWLMFVCVTMLHFSLSEAELSHSHHLWQWLDDYSLHQLNNQTTSNSTLMFLASFDNYIYTVHVYGTRLIGASIVCIVCYLQGENISSLRWNTLQLIQSHHANARFTAPLQLAVGKQQTSNHTTESHNNESRWSSATSSNGGGGDATRYNISSLSSSSVASLLLSSSCLKDRDLFFILGESDWLKVRENISRLKPCGYLSSSFSLAQCWLREKISQCARILIRSIGMRQYRAIGFRWLFRRSTTTTTFTATNAADSSSSCANGTSGGDHATNREKLSARSGRITPTPTCSNAASSTNVTTTLDQIATSIMMNHSAAIQSDNLRPTPNRGKTITETNHHYLHYRPHPPHVMADHYSRNHQPANSRLLDDANNIEWQIGRLASKYELVRTVNARIDSCFGPMLLIQYSFLFLMSCIDVVYFSICFSPRTKTKYIIISGMILLWWPYLLLYRYASDIGSSSKELLISVRRLARLSIIEHHQSIHRATSVQCSPIVRYLSPLYYNGELSIKSKYDQVTNYSMLDTANRFLHESSQSLAPGSGGGGFHSIGKARARIVNKLDHVFKPTHLTIMGIMAIDKFFLLNFAKIVITASVMMIQFIT